MKHTFLKKVAFWSITSALIASTIITPGFAAGKTNDMIFEYTTGNSPVKTSNTQYERIWLNSFEPGMIAFSRDYKRQALQLTAKDFKLSILNYYLSPFQLRTAEINDMLYMVNPIDHYNWEWNGFREMIIGTAYDDYFDAGSGDDLIYGGAGNDHLTGGDGSDTYVFNGNFGSDWVFESCRRVFNNNEGNALVFGDLKTSDVDIQQSDDKLIIQSHSNPKNQVTVPGFFSGVAPVQTFSFTDATVNADFIKKTFEEAKKATPSGK